MDRINPYFAVILAGAIWGLGGAFVKIIDLPATSFAFLRCFVPFIILALYFTVKKIQPFHGNIKMMMGASILNAVRMYLFFVAFLYAPISQAVILIYTWPVFASIYAVFFLKERISFKKAGLMAMAFAGIIVIFLGNESSSNGVGHDMLFIGLGAMLLHSVIYAATVVIFKNEIKNYSNWETIFYQVFAGAFIFLPFIFINQPMPEPWQLSAATFWMALLGLGSFGLFFMAMKKLDMVTISILSYTEIVIMITIGILFFQENLTLNMAIGATMIVASTYIITRYKNKI